jgi:hypothetical protein
MQMNPLQKQGVGDFRYFVGTSSLAQIATRDDRVCVLNILGAESSEVTPIGHAWSGGNVVFGTAPGKGGQALATAAGDIPVYNVAVHVTGRNFWIVELDGSGVRRGGEVVEVREPPQ